MDKKGTSEIKPRNPITQASHRREVFWQITIPVILAALVIVALAVLTGLSSAPQVRQMADVAIIWMVAPALVIALVFLLVFAGLTYVTVKLIRALPVFSYRVLDILFRVRERARQISDMAVKPVTTTSGFTAAVQTFFRKTFGKRRAV